MHHAQHELLVKPQMIEVDLATIDAQPSMTSALVLCQSLAGLQDKELAGDKGIVKHTEQWSKIKNGSGFFPQDKLLPYMHRCRNEAPLIWLARRSGYELVPLESELERRLRLERERADRAEERLAYAESLLVRK
jgi:hypothetical protein